MTEDNVRKHLVELNQGMVDAERQAQSADIEFLRTVLSEDLFFRRADKSIDGKTEFLAKVPAGAVRLKDRQSSDIEIAIKENTALITLLITGTVEKDGARLKKAFRNIRFFVQGPRANWQLLHWYNEEVPTP